MKRLMLTLALVGGFAALAEETAPAPVPQPPAAMKRSAISQTCGMSMEPSGFFGRRINPNASRKGLGRNVSGMRGTSFIC